MARDNNSERVTDANATRNADTLRTLQRQQGRQSAQAAAAAADRANASRPNGR